MNKQTQENLYQLRLHGFIQAYEDIIQQSNDSELSISEALTIMTDREICLRENKRQARLLKLAKLRYPQANYESIDYRLPRKFNQQQFKELGHGQWIIQARNIIITGPTGVGKSYIACALGQLACRQLYAVQYYRVGRLVDALRISHVDGTYSKLLERLAKKLVLILDDWGIDQLDRQGRRDLLEVLEDRCGRSATVITSQLPISSWHDYIGDNTIADAICDRIINNAYCFNIEGESIRKIGIT